jgi:putative phage-type endonuclease
MTITKKFPFEVFMKKINVEQNTPEWIAWRAGKIGASVSPAVLGKSNFSTAYQVWLEMTGRARAFEGNSFTEAGKEAEPKARAEYEMAHGDFEIFAPICVEHELYPTMIASLDGYNEKLKRIVEIKYPSEKSHEMAKAGEVPEHYWIQCQHQLACVPEATHLHYWSYRESDGAMVNVERDAQFIEDILIPACLAFKELVEINMPPALTEKDAKWEENPAVLELCEKLKTVEDKETKNELSAKIIELAGHPRVLCKDVRVTSVQKKGVHSYYKVTLKGGA